jgi:UDP-N-acetylglucosamine 2-epimerase (non-hydrolysing)
LKIVLVAGARPNFMKIAPIMEAFAHYPSIQPFLVHTGQHYDERLSDLFFRQLEIPWPDVNLGVGSSSHAVQTAEVMKAFEPVLLEQRPDAVLVVGDVNSTIACGLVAVKLGIKLIHVEAGLRSFDRSMPEEINRLLTDAISDLLFCSEPAGVENLRREGISPDKIFLVGNVMIDTLLKFRKKAEESTILQTLGLIPHRYAVLTLHRPSNVDDPEALTRLLDALKVIARELPIVFPVHPRTHKNLSNMGLMNRLADLGNLRLIEPIGYLEFLKLMAWAVVVLTDSGGIQEETTILKVPCLTLRPNTERPITTEVGTSRVVGTDPDGIIAGWRDIQGGRWPRGKIPEKWDGKAAQRIVQVMSKVVPEKESEIHGNRAGE